VEISRLAVGDEATVVAMSHLFDGQAVRAHVERFLHDETHHLLVAREGDVLMGFISGVEMTHPDKGTEMFLYELAVDDPWRRQGIGASLVSALSDLARERGCYGMWVLTDDDNDAALATYASAGGARSNQVMLDWTFSQSPESSSS
jgi:ribosomal protein S18 acetylase RimI-like enzyme